MDWPSNTPDRDLDRNRVRVAAWCTCFCPGLRRSSQRWIASALTGTPGGQPSTVAPSAGPWLSPHVVTRKRWPKVLKDMGPRLSFRFPGLSPPARNAKPCSPLVVRRFAGIGLATPRGGRTWPEMRSAMREPVEPEPVRTGGGKVSGRATQMHGQVSASLRPSQWRSEHETHHTCSGIDLGFGRCLRADPPCSRSIPMTVSIPRMGPGAGPAVRGPRSRKPAAAICNSWARATARRFCRASGWRGRGPRRTLSSASTRT